MNIDFSKIVNDKLAQMDADGIIQRRIEECVEQSVLNAITYEIGTSGFSATLRQHLKECVSEAAQELGLSGYNGYIAQAVKAIVTDMQREDIAEKVRAALEGTLLKKYESVKLSEIFEKYREWVRDAVDEADQRDREEFTAELVKMDRRPFAGYKCRFAEESIEKNEKADIEIYISDYGPTVGAKLGSLVINGYNLRDTLRIGALTEFEAFVANLYYNRTKIILDLDDVGDDCSFHVHYGD